MKNLNLLCVILVLITCFSFTSEYRINKNNDVFLIAANVANDINYIALQKVRSAIYERTNEIIGMQARTLEGKRAIHDFLKKDSELRALHKESRRFNRYLRKTIVGYQAFNVQDRKNIWETAKKISRNNYSVFNANQNYFYRFSVKKLDDPQPDCDNLDNCELCFCMWVHKSTLSRAKHEARLVELDDFDSACGDWCDAEWWSQGFTDIYECYYYCGDYILDLQQEEFTRYDEETASLDYQLSTCEDTYCN